MCRWSRERGSHEGADERNEIGKKRKFYTQNVFAEGGGVWVLFSLSQVSFTISIGRNCSPEMSSSLHKVARCNNTKRAVERGSLWGESWKLIWTAGRRTSLSKVGIKRNWHTLIHDFMLLPFSESEINVNGTTNNSPGKVKREEEKRNKNIMRLIDWVKKWQTCAGKLKLLFLTLFTLPSMWRGNRRLASLLRLFSPSHTNKV